MEGEVCTGSLAMGGAVTLEGDLLAAGRLLLSSRSRDGSFRMESLLVIVPEEWIMLANSSFMMKLTVFFFFLSVSVLLVVVVCLSIPLGWVELVTATDVVVAVVDVG